VSDLDLVHILCTSDEDQKPYNEFVRRFLPEVKDGCKKKCKLKRLDPHIGEGIAHEVFARIRRSKLIKKEKIKNADHHKGILSYLLITAEHLFVDHFREEKRSEEVHETYFDELQGQAQTINPEHLKSTKDMAETLFKKLNAKEQAVVLADLEHKRVGKYLPDEVTEALSKSLNVKPATIRKIRERAIEKLKGALHEINQA
jgi:DNA-directed RNA polymerase specialized sigma24 family protein